MLEPYAELIGDPVEHSLSPAIHRHWLEELGLPGSYRAHRCPPDALTPYLAGRRDHPLWRGCNVTMPLKRTAVGRADKIDADVAATGATNLLVRRDGRLHAYNTDIAGIEAALGDSVVDGRRAVVIGAGGAARAAVAALGRRGAHVVVLARDAAQRLDLLPLAPGTQGAPIYAIREAIEGAAVVVNATPLGMAGKAMPAALLDHFKRAPGALAFDMVYRPVETEFLAAARAAGLRTADGLTMLIGQARRAFELLFRVAPPPDDAELRSLLLRAG